MTNKEDLRYVRTETAIRDSFMELVRTEPVSSVTASMLCRRAGISRNAFYLHHASVSALYTALVQELVDDVRAQSLGSVERRSATGRDDELSKELLSALARHENFLRALLPSDDGSLGTCLAQGIEGAFEEAVECFGSGENSLEHRLRCAYLAWALVGITTRWILDTDRPLIEAVECLTELQSGPVEAFAHRLLDE